MFVDEDGRWVPCGYASSLYFDGTVRRFEARVVAGVVSSALVRENRMVGLVKVVLTSHAQTGQDFKQRVGRLEGTSKAGVSTGTLGHRF